MTLRKFKSTIIDRLPMKIGWRHAEFVDRAFDVCLEEFEPFDLEGVLSRVEARGYGFPYALLIQIIVQLILHWLENRKHEERQEFLGWQREMKAINERA